MFFLPPAALTAAQLPDGRRGAYALVYSSGRNEINQPELCELWGGDEVFGGLSLQPAGGGGEKLLSAKVQEHSRPVLKKKKKETKTR